jgi:hypothetical protein
MTKALKITAGGQLSAIDVHEISDYQREVGGYIQAVPIGTTHQMILNEDGKDAGLPHNPIADVLTKLGETGLAHDDFIVGDVLIVSSRVNDENWHDVEDGLVQTVREIVDGI